MDLHIGGRGKGIYITVPYFHIFHRHCLVRTPGGQDLDLETILGNFLMMFERVNGIVGRTDDFHIHLKHKIAGTVIRCAQHLATGLIDFLGGFRVEQLVYAEITLQFHMGPVIERIAQAVRNSLGPLFEFFVVTGSTGAEAFLDTVSAQGPPLIVVSVQPYLGQIFEILILGDLGRGEVTMIVVNGQGGCIFIICLLYTSDAATN